MKARYLPYLYAVISFLVIRFLIGFDGLYGQDSYEYLRYSEAIHQYLTQGEHPGNYFWSVGFPLLAGVISLTGVPVLIVIQLINLASILGIIYFTDRLIKEHYSNVNNISIYLLFAIASSPFLLQSSMVAMTDISTTFFLIGAFYFGLKYEKETRLKWLFYFTWFFCSAVFIRYVAIIPLSMIGLLVAVTWLRKLKWIHLSVILIPVLFIAVHVHFKQNEMGMFLSHQWLVNWSPINMVRYSFETVDGSHSYSLPNIFYAFSPFVHIGFLLIGSLLVVVYLKVHRNILTQKHTLLICAAVGIYALFLAGIPFQNKRFLLITFPLIVVLLSPAYQSVVDFVKDKLSISSRYIVFTVACLILVNIGLTIYVMRAPVQRSLMEKRIARLLSPYQGKTLYAFDIDIALRGRGCKFDYKNLWVEEYVNYEIGGLVIFNEEKLAQQWKGMNPMINWNKLKKNHELILQKSFGEGWNLYEIK